jgi:hypothetical protein
MEVNKWLPSFVGMKRKPKKEETGEGQTEHRNEIGVRSFERTSTRERKTRSDKSMYWASELLLPEKRVT